MNPNDRENQSDPELLIDIECTPEGFEVRVSRGGKVRYLDRGYKTRDDAWAAGRVFVKNWLRAQLQASGIARRGERPAFQAPVYHGLCCSRCGSIDDCDCADVVPPMELAAPVLVGAAALEPEAIWVAPADPIACPESLEGEQLCSCGHSDGVHLLGANTCAFEPCKCEEFTAALAFVGAAALEPKAIWVAPTDPIACQEALEGEQLCSCGHSDGVHLLGANACAFEPCKCEEFTAALAVEAVQ